VVELEPKTVKLAIGSSPAGIELTAGLLQGLSPLSLTAIEGSHVLLSAPETAQLGGHTYTWQSWSDGGERIHTVTADSSRAITAAYTTPPSPPSSPSPPPPPSASVRKHPGKKTGSTTATFKFSSSEAGTSFKCKLDKKPFKPCRSPVTYSHLKAGAHTFAVVAIGSGGQGQPAKFSWKVLPKKR
jgi:hypothetical protein